MSDEMNNEMNNEMNDEMNDEWDYEVDDESKDANDASIPEFDPNYLMDILALAGRITKDELRSFSDDPDALIDAIQDTASVLSLSWSTDSPGGSGALHVHRWKGLYFLDSLDWGLEGPVLSLAEILADERFNAPCPAPELASDALPETELIALAQKVLPDDESTVKINDVLYRRSDSGDLIRAN